MARTIAQIQTQTTAAYVAAMAVIGIAIDPTQWSRRNLQQLTINIVSTAIAIFEQILDAYTIDIETAIALAAPQTFAWFKAQMLAFQFNATNPQIIQFNTTTFAPYYTIVNTSYQVITYCSVVPGNFGTTTIKVAAQVNGLPADLDSTYPGALAAAQSYALQIGVPGITYNVQSGAADVFYCYATIYYQGGYSAIIQANIIAAITNYLNGIPFYGYVTLSALEEMILAVPGVNDMVFTNVQGGPNGTAYGNGTVLVYGTDGVNPIGTIVSRNFSTIAGYIATPTSGGNQLINTLTLIAQ